MLSFDKLESEVVASALVKYRSSCERYRLSTDPVLRSHFQDRVVVVNRLLDRLAKEISDAS